MGLGPSALCRELAGGGGVGGGVGGGGGLLDTSCVSFVLWFTGAASRQGTVRLVHICQNAPPSAAGFTPGAASGTALSASYAVGTNSDLVYCAFRDESVTPHRMSVYKINATAWYEVSRGSLSACPPKR